MSVAVVRTTVVVPCYNEEDRLREEEFVRYLSRPDTAVRLLFVDDGSSDGTVQVLERIVKAAPLCCRSLPMEGRRRRFAVACSRRSSSPTQRRWSAFGTVIWRLRWTPSRSWSTCCKGSRGPRWSLAPASRCWDGRSSARSCGTTS